MNYFEYNHRKKEKRNFKKRKERAPQLLFVLALGISETDRILSSHWTVIRSFPANTFLSSIAKKRKNLRGAGALCLTLREELVRRLHLDIDLNEDQRRKGDLLTNSLSGRQCRQARAKTGRCVLEGHFVAKSIDRMSLCPARSAMNKTECSKYYAPN